MMSKSSEERDYGLAPVERLRELSGYDFLARMRDGQLPAPPIARILGFDLAEVEPGRVVFRGEPAYDYYNPLGSVHGGWPATLLDSCMGCAVHSALPAGTGYTTLEFKIDIVRPITEATGTVAPPGRSRPKAARSGSGVASVSPRANCATPQGGCWHGAAPPALFLRTDRRRHVAATRKSNAMSEKSSAGWRTPLIIIVAGCLISMIGFGPRSVLGLFLEPMTLAHGWGRETFGLAMAIQNLLWGIGVPVCRSPARWPTVSARPGSSSAAH